MPDANGYLEPSRTSTKGFFGEKFSIKIHKETPVPESLFNKVTGLYPETSMKERTPAQVFSD